jgi:hypothetical protein
MALGIGISGPRGGSGGGGGTLTIGVFSDAGHTTPITSADFGDTVYINITTSIASPTEYRFLIFESSIIGNYTLQAGATLSYTIASFNDLIIFAEAEDGSTVAAALAPFDLTINADADANAYISAHNTASGTTMAGTQQEVVQETFKRLKGIGTSFGSNLFAKLLSANGELYAFTPVSSAVVSLPTIAIDWIEPSVLSTIVGFVPSDVANDGVTGGSGKYLALKRAPSDYSQNSISLHAFSRTAGLAGFYNITPIGASDSASLGGNRCYFYASTSYGSVHLNAVSTSVINAASDGLISVNRANASTQEKYIDGLLVGSGAVASTTPSTNTFYGFAVHAGATSFSNFSGKLAMICNADSFTANELTDWNEVWQYFTANMNN